MAIARFKDLCIDANDPALLGRFWSRVLARPWQPDEVGEGVLVGPTPQHGVWINQVPEPKTVKHRVHVDIWTESLAELASFGATVVRAQGDDLRWTVFADPEGGEFCAFVRDGLPDDLMHGLVVDSVDPGAQARWWASVYGADVIDDPYGFSTVEHVPGMPIQTMDFVPVPEPKTVKNRVHWDVTVDAIEPLIEAGATVLREPDGDISWFILADPEGNEFCAFVEPES